MMDEFVKKHTDHLAFLKDMLKNVHDKTDHFEIERDIATLEKNIEAMQKWQESQVKIKSQTQTLAECTENGDVRLDYPYSHQPNGVKPEPGTIRPEDV